MRSIAFVLDPDGYWVEIIGQKPLAQTESVEDTDLETYRMVIPLFSIPVLDEPLRRGRAAH